MTDLEMKMQDVVQAKHNLRASEEELRKKIADLVRKRFPDFDEFPILFIKGNTIFLSAYVTWNEGDNEYDVDLDVDHFDDEDTVVVTLEDADGDNRQPDVDPLQKEERNEKASS